MNTPQMQEYARVTREDAAKLRLNPWQAQQAFDRGLERAKARTQEVNLKEAEAQKRANDILNREWGAERANRDKEVEGFVSHFADEDTVNFLNTSGLSADPRFKVMMSNIQQKFRTPEALATGNVPGAVNNQATKLADLRAQRNALPDTPENKGARDDLYRQIQATAATMGTPSIGRDGTALTPTAGNY